MSDMFSASVIRDAILRLMSQQISLDDFDEWFAQNSWNVHKSSDWQAQRLAYVIELRLAEFDSGHLPEGELRQELAGLSFPMSVVMDENSQVQAYLPVASSGSITFASPVNLPSELPVGGKTLSKAS